MATLVPEVLATFELDDLLRFQLAHALDVRQREGVGLLADLHHQAAHHGQGQRHLDVKQRSLPLALLHAHAAAQLADHVLHGVQSDAATGHLGDLLAHAEAGQEEKRQEFLLAQLRHGLGGGELAIEHGLAQALQIDAAAVVAQFQDQHAGVVAGADGDPALGRLAGGEAGFRRLDTVIDGIA